MIILDLNNDGMQRAFKPCSLEFITPDGKRAIKGQIKNWVVGEEAPIVTVYWDGDPHCWVLPKREEPKKKKSPAKKVAKTGK